MLPSKQLVRRLFVAISPVLTVGMLVFLVHFGAVLVAVDGAVHGSGRSMSHGPMRLPGIDDDGDYARIVPALGKEDIITFAEAIQDDYQIAGDYGDVIRFWPYGVRDSILGPIATDPNLSIPPTALADPHRVRHRAMAWVEFNESSGMFDVPSLNLTNVSRFVLRDTGSWNSYANAYLHSNLTVVLVEIDTTGRVDYPVGKYSGFVTKGDYYYEHDQHVIGKDEEGKFQLSLFPLVRPEWVVGKVVEIIDAETLQPIHDAALAAFVVGEAAIVVLLVRRHRGKIAAVLGRRNA